MASAVDGATRDAAALVEELAAGCRRPEPTVMLRDARACLWAARGLVAAGKGCADLADGPAAAVGPCFILTAKAVCTTSGGDERMSLTCVPEGNQPPPLRAPPPTTISAHARSKAIVHTSSSCLASPSSRDASSFSRVASRSRCAAFSSPAIFTILYRRALI